GKVVLRGLAINGLGGDIGVNFVSGDALYVDNCVISGFTNTGLNAVVSTSAAVYVRDSTIRDNFNGAFFGTTYGAAGSLQAHVERSAFKNNASAGIGFTGFGAASATIANSILTGGMWGLYMNPAGGAISNVEVRGATITRNATSGMRVGGISGTTAA